MNNNIDNSRSNNGYNVSKPVRLGLRLNINQFLILVLVNAFVGAMIGLKQTVVPLIGEDEFGIQSNALVVSFITSFGAVKGVLNLFAGSMSDMRKKEYVGIRMAVWFTCSIYLVICSRLEFDYFC